MLVVSVPRLVAVSLSFAAAVASAVAAFASVAAPVHAVPALAEPGQFARLASALRAPPYS